MDRRRNRSQVNMEKRENRFLISLLLVTFELGLSGFVKNSALCLKSWC